MAELEAVIGLEVHAHLKTRTKMFCRCALEYGAGENTRTCPVCLAHPGALPVPNARAIEQTIKLGLALGCEISEHAVFAASSSRCARTMPITRSPSGPGTVKLPAPQMGESYWEIW